MSPLQKVCLPPLLPLDTSLNLITSYWLVPSGYGSACGGEPSVWRGTQRVEGNPIQCFHLYAICLVPMP